MGEGKGRSAKKGGRTREKIKGEVRRRLKVEGVKLFAVEDSVSYLVSICFD